MMIAKKCLVAAALVAVCGSLAVNATGVSAGVAQLPWRATFSGAAAFTSPTTTLFVGKGNASYMGRIRSDGHVCLPSPTCAPLAAVTCPGGIPNVNVEVLTEVNLFGQPADDTLTLVSQDVACPTGPDQFHGMGHWTVSGGTGRFRYAIGQGTFDGHVDFNAGTYSMTLVGNVGPIALL
jgi:hypothetical protein